VLVDGHTRTKYKLGTRAAGPYNVLSRAEGTFSLDISGYPETVSSDHVTAAPGPPGNPQTLLQNLGVPQDILVLEKHQHTRKELVWKAFVGHDVADDGTRRLWTRWWWYHPNKDTLELASRFDVRKVTQYMRRVGLRVEEAGSGVEFLDKDSSHAGHVGFKCRVVADSWFRHVSGRSRVAVAATVPTAWRNGSLPRDPAANQGDRIAWTVLGGGGGTRRLTGVSLSDDGPQGGIGIWVDEQGALPSVICKRPAWGLLVADAP